MEIHKKKEPRKKEKNVFAVNAFEDYKTLKFCSAKSAALGAGPTHCWQTKQDKQRKSSVHILSNDAQRRNSKTQIRFERHDGSQQAEDVGLSHRLLFLLIIIFFWKPIRPSYRLTGLREKEKQRVKSEGNILMLCFTAPAGVAGCLPCFHFQSWHDLHWGLREGRQRSSSPERYLRPLWLFGLHTNAWGQGG